MLCPAARSIPLGLASFIGVVPGRRRRRLTDGEEDFGLVLHRGPPWVSSSFGFWVGTSIHWPPKLRGRFWLGLSSENLSRVAHPCQNRRRSPVGRALHRARHRARCPAEGDLSGLFLSPPPVQGDRRVFGGRSDYCGGRMFFRRSGSAPGEVVSPWRSRPRKATALPSGVWVRSRGW